MAAAVLFVLPFVGSPQLHLLVLAALIGVILQDPTRILIGAVVVVPFLGGLRRIVAADEGRVDNDFLILIPYVLVLVAVIFGIGRRVDGDGKQAALGLAVILCGISAAMSTVLSRALDVASLFSLTSTLMPLIAAWAIARHGSLDIWSKLMRILPAVALIPGIYGIIQFTILPEWDRRWMLASELTSIGSPEPFQVRVFGFSESPGPYAVFLGIAIVLALSNAVNRKGLLRFSQLAIAIALLPGLLLSGVRTALIGVIVCIVLLAVFRASGGTRIALLVFVGVAVVAVNFLVSRFGDISNVLTADRYLDLDLENDYSFQTRTGILDYLANPFVYLVGRPQTPLIDNYLVNVLVRFGLVAALSLVYVLLRVGIGAFRALRTRLSSETATSAALTGVFALILSVAGDPSPSPVALVVGIAFGSAILGGSENRDVTKVNHNHRTSARLLKH